MKTPIRFDEYYLVERVAVGGMAEVFQGVTYSEEGFERQMAVKRVLPHIAEDQEFIEMFVDEAKLVSQLQHPNIPQIYHLGRCNDQYFISMEYISGQDLRAIFDRARGLGRSLDLGLCAHIVMEVCEALDYAHRKTNSRLEPLNLIHRDVSPQNIIIGYDGTVKLIDFGIAKATGQINQTQAGILKGKFSYMSPEQARGYPIDSRSDLFGLGAVLYEIITLERCFLGQSDFSTIERVRNVEYQQPRQIRRDVPVALERLIRRALAKTPEERFQSAADLQETLRQVARAHRMQKTRKDLGAFMSELFSQEITAERDRMINFRAYAAEHIPQAQGRHESRRFRRVSPEELKVEVSRPRFALREEIKLSLDQQNAQEPTETIERQRRERDRPTVESNVIIDDQEQPTPSGSRLALWSMFTSLVFLIGSVIVAVSWYHRPLASALWIDDPHQWNARFELSGQKQIYRGDGPELLVPLEPGDYRVQFSSLEGRPTVQTASIKSGEERRVKPPELPNRGKVALYLTSTPLGAEVKIRRKSYGVTPLELILPNTQVKLMVSAPGYQSEIFSLKPGKGLRESIRGLHFNLTPLEVTWSIKTGLSQARVEIKDERVQGGWRLLGRGYQSVKLSNQEAHMIRVSAPGYVSQTVALPPQTELTHELLIALKPISPPQEGRMISSAIMSEISQPRARARTPNSVSADPRSGRSETPMRETAESKVDARDDEATSQRANRRSSQRANRRSSQKTNQRANQRVSRASRASRASRRASRRATSTSSSGGQPGFLKLIAFPPAEVFLGGRSLGWTPLINQKLSEGTHRLRLRFRSGEEMVISQSISAGRVSLRRIKR